ncbi:antibiotic biosynthesis monooxygenase family protein [Kribbella sp. CA-293567]|uniref:antibiotic biosynthesis monooxygenase family protein n=1 Tax=Kribbella sp. CA-293567 TaxID=3002436 RepID=UPI0022DE6758|nr:antibiotic biosynthesis monooxygenase [Kribbella sp. CA-293567]WBQ04789.1 antibiotic biosynthesis monooxygenase [Kribbella sp. CA-293567]
MSTIELTRFKVAADHEAELLAARPEMLADFAADRAGFLAAQLVRLPAGEWLDIVEWESPEDFAASREKGGNLPGIARFFAAIESLVSAEEGTVAAVQKASR